MKTSVLTIRVGLAMVAVIIGVATVQAGESKGSSVRKSFGGMSRQFKSQGGQQPSSRIGSHNMPKFNQPSSGGPKIHKLPQGNFGIGGVKTMPHHKLPGTGIVGPSKPKFDPGKLPQIGIGKNVPIINPGKFKPLDPGIGNGQPPKINPGKIKDNDWGLGNHHHGQKTQPFCWPKQCKPYWCPTVWWQPTYCAPAHVVCKTVVVHSPMVQIVDPAQFPMVAVGSKVALQGKVYGPQAGQVVMQVGTLIMPIKVEAWQMDQIIVELPLFGLTSVTHAQLHVFGADGTQIDAIDLQLVAPPTN